MSEQQREATLKVHDVSVRLGELSVKEEMLKPLPRNCEIVWIFRPLFPIPGCDVTGRWRADPNAPFCFSVGGDISTASLHLQEQIWKSESHGGALVVQEQTALQSKLEQASLLISSLNSYPNREYFHVP